MASESDLHRRADIQGLRAIAVLIVVAFHARLPIDGGFAGVDVFFVISGYVITAMLAREWQSTGRIDLRQFYVRRALRLTPALALTIFFVVLASVVMLSASGPQQTTARTGIGALLFAANLVIARAAGDYFAPTAAENPLLNTWSLSVEEQFYVVFPAAMIAAFWIGRAVARPVLVPALALCLSIGLSFGLSVAWVDGSSFASGLTDLFGGPQAFAFYGLPARIWEFGIGALLAIARFGGFEVSHGFRELVGALGIGLVAASALLLDGSARFPGWLALAPVSGTGLLLVAGWGSGSTSSRLLSCKPLVLIGDWSYSIYLWHWPMIVFASIAFPDEPSVLIVAATICFLPAWLSYHGVEQPLRRWRPQTARTAVGSLVVILAVPITLAGGLIEGANTEWSGLAEDPLANSRGVHTSMDGSEPSAGSAGGGDANLRRNEHASGEKNRSQPISRAWRSAHAVVAAGCVHTDIDPTRCRFGPQEAKGWVLLVGDSQAYAMADGLIAAATELGFAVVASSRVGCPFVGSGSIARRKKGCASWQKQALEFALTSRPDAVVIANRSPSYIYPERVWLAAVDTRGMDAPLVANAAASWRQGLENVVVPLHEAGIPVVIVAAVAEMPRAAGQRSIFEQAYGGSPIEVELSEALAHRLPAHEVELAIADRHPGVSVFDPLGTLCGDVCPSAVEGTLLYQDTTHLSLDGALLLAPDLRSVLSDVL